MKAYEVQKFGIDDLALVGRDEPQVKPSEVLVKFRAARL
jgi:NADPH:quinone reductase-like Zn-dependent oxidoreductase